jgi:6-hydroxytryprostatin B O-methyltransferase
VPFNSTIAYDVLAARLGLDTTQLKQFLRQLMMIHCFTEIDGKVAHTATSKLLCNDREGAMNSLMVEDNLKMVAKQIEALERWGHGSQDITQAAFNEAFETDKYIYGYFEDHEALGTRFSNTMSWTSTLDPMSSRHVLAGYDWASLGDATIVDVAGSLGAHSVQIAQANPKLKMIVQDLPEVVKRAKDPSTTVVPEDMRDRFTFMVQDFFEPQAVQYADVYFQRMNYHNYSDKYSVRILQSLVSAMGPQSRIIISDQLLPPPGVAPAPIERFMRAQDLQMLLWFNAKERSHDQWESLLKLADERLRIKNVVTPPASAMSFIEVVLDSREGD